VLNRVGWLDDRHGSSPILFDTEPPFAYIDQLCAIVFSSTPVVPKLVRDVTQIKVAIMSHYPQYFAVIAHNTEQHCGFGSVLLPEESHITPRE